MNKAQENIVVILKRLISLVEEDEDFAECFADDLELMLDEIHSNDGFGTEGQSDPRGDFRDGK